MFVQRRASRHAEDHCGVATAGGRGREGHRRLRGVTFYQAEPTPCAALLLLSISTELSVESSCALDRNISIVPIGIAINPDVLTAHVQ